jgi:hypothetical protein
MNTNGERECGERASHSEDKQIRPIEPSRHDRKVFGQGIDEHDNQEDRDRVDRA